VLKKSDIENAALTNASKDSEVVSDSSIDNMLDQLNLNRNSTKDLGIVEGLSRQRGSKVEAKAKRPKARLSPKAARPKLSGKPKRAGKKKR